ncbi:MAG: 30S ribosomal protein S8 [Polyangiaceae bacterium]
MLTDPISDMLARIKNAITANHLRTVIPANRLKLRVAEILKQEGYISDVREETNTSGHKNLEIVLKYDRNRKPALDGIRRVSRPGRRVYVRKGDIPYVYSGLGTAILSTSSGVMTDGDARKKGVGGEVICEVW